MTQNILYFRKKFIIAIDLKACALFVIIFLEQPNLAKIFSSKIFITTEFVAFRVGIASTHFEK
jgi:hypothetical protein